MQQERTKNKCVCDIECARVCVSGWVGVGGWVGGWVWVCQCVYVTKEQKVQPENNFKNNFKNTKENQKTFSKLCLKALTKTKLNLPEMRCCGTLMQDVRKNK